MPKLSRTSLVNEAHTQQVEVHRAGCHCSSCEPEEHKERSQRTNLTTPHKRHRKSSPCPPGCHCGRHRSKRVYKPCPPGCTCRRHDQSGKIKGAKHCAPDCTCGRHSPKHPRNNKCEPGCTCGKHRAVHHDNCKCRRCVPYRRPKAQKPKVIKIKQPKRKSGFMSRPDVCVCAHVKMRHDLFGCKTCAEQREKGLPWAVNCTAFQARNGYAKRADETVYEERIKAEGFIKHNGDIATCTDCWMPIKVGPINTLGAVIGAKAHNQICTARVRAERENRGPDRAKPDRTA